MKKVLAVSSGGGHWIELLRVMPAFKGYSVSYATVRGDYRDDVPGAAFYAVNDATRWNPFRLVVLAIRVFLVVRAVRPHVVISTGSAPGYFAVRFGKLLGARTIWIESIANSEHLSRSGRLAGRYADLWLTQWPALASQDGPRYAGQVL